MVVSDKKSRVKAVKRPKTRRSSQLVDEDSSEVKIKKKEVTSPLVSPSAISGVLMGDISTGDCPLVDACGR